MNKAPAFIISQFGFTKDNVAERITAPDPKTVVIKIAEPQSPDLPALLPVGQCGRRRRQEDGHGARPEATIWATPG